MPFVVFYFFIFWPEYVKKAIMAELMPFIKKPGLFGIAMNTRNRERPKEAIQLVEYF